ncbi:hypothetical protein [Bosea sp. FBZP-16]|uniref:hypothetical protein n=1 Tax=Bosea sp. FBZP-16 TaxID=2065382 RepID=UPI001319CA05|nr:hypothetical protein [Bosea sp. FBZP-16]
MTNTIAIFQISTEEDLRFQLDFNGLNLSGRTLKVNVRERVSNTLKVSLAAPANLTLVGTGNLTAFYAKSSMASWAKGEYEADVIDETGGNFTRLMAVRFVYDNPGRLVHGVKGNQATVNWGGNQAVVTAIGGVGPPGPVNVLTIGDVDTLETGEPATAEITGSAPNQALNLGLPKGNTGATGPSGTVTVNPTTITGAPGSNASVANTGTPEAAVLQFTLPRGNTGLTGDDGWSPVLAVVTDSQRRVLQISDWTGGEGTKPATGSYIGPTGLVPDAASAVDVRGAQGPSGSVTDGDKGDIVVSGSGTTWTIDAKAGTFSKLQDVATGIMLGRKTGGTGSIEELSRADVIALVRLGIFGQCELIKDGSNIRLLPKGGNRIFVNGDYLTVPDAGVAKAATGLTVSTQYYVYAINSGGSVDIELTTTAPARSATYGHLIEGTNDARTYVGTVRPITGPAFQDTAQQRFVRSWFGRTPTVLRGALTAQRTTGSSSWVEVNSEARCEFLLQPGEIVRADITGYSFNSGSSTTFASVGYDSSSSNEDASATFGSAGGSIGYSRPKSGLSAGYHDARLLGRVSGGTGTYSATSPEFTAMHLTIQ